ncbi:MAG: KpsF/GutQ family sugar-phosphate isomerase [Rhodocyclaceae bacterium]|nr:KpsF/GutQ family sugar-phosphate isomerase [Rhodocyclaceae bacterium]
MSANSTAGAPNKSAQAQLDDARILTLARAVLRTEADALIELEPKLGDAFVQAVRALHDSPGRVIVSGMGKSGHVARKMAATFASTGTPAYFVHPAEASHGDLGMITGDDVFLALSYSGESDELAAILPVLRRLGTRIIALTGNTQSSLAREADIVLDGSVAREACPHNLAPTASTTAALALGDALAVALLEARGFSPEDFALSHPGGALGRRLLTHVSDVMHTKADLACVGPDSSLADAVLAISRGSLGMTVIIDTDDRVLGIFTDGDLRRAFGKQLDLQQVRVRDVMTAAPKTIGADRLAVEAVALMEKHRINQLVVTQADGRLIGALNMHDLFRAKVV